MFHAHLSPFVCEAILCFDLLYPVPFSHFLQGIARISWFRLVSLIVRVGVCRLRETGAGDIRIVDFHDFESSTRANNLNDFEVQFEEIRVRAIFRHE